MIDATPKVISTLTTALGNTVNVCYDMFLDSSKLNKTTVSVAESSNINVLGSSDGLYYDYIDYQIKVYSNSLQTVFTTAISAESAMRSLGFRLQGSNQLIDGNYICKVMTFRAMTQDGIKSWITLN